MKSQYYNRSTSASVTCEVGDYVIWECQPSSNVDVFFAQSKVSGATRINSYQSGASGDIGRALFIATSTTVTWNYGNTGGYVISVLVLRP